MRATPGLEDFWQLHRSEAGGTENNSPDSFLANVNEKDHGHFLHMSVRTDGSFTITNSRTGFKKDTPRSRQLEALRPPAPRVWAARPLRCRAAPDVSLREAAQHAGTSPSRPHVFTPAPDDVGMFRRFAARDVRHSPRPSCEPCGAGCPAERAGLRAGGLGLRRRLKRHASRWVAEPARGVEIPGAAGRSCRPSQLRYLFGGAGNPLW